MKGIPLQYKTSKLLIGIGIIFDMSDDRAASVIRVEVILKLEAISSFEIFRNV
jgi:hypothetical protein